MKTSYIFKNACLLACLALGLSSTQVKASDRVEVGGVFYKVIDFNGARAAEVVPRSIAADSDYNVDRYSGSITIPAEVSIGGTTYPVKSIGDNAMRTAPALTNVILPEGLEKIGNGAFASCTGFTAITLPSTVTYIDEWAFQECSNLETINIPDGVTFIGHHAFQYAGLTSITLPAGLKRLEGCVFQHATKLASINLENITFIGEWALYETAITSVEISDMFNIGRWALSKCPNLEKVVLKNVFEIGEWCFQDSEKIKTVELGDLEALNDGAFSGCKALTSIKFPSSLVYLGAWALQHTSITEIYAEWTEPDDVVIDENAFGGYDDDGNPNGLLDFVWKMPETLKSIYGNEFMGYPIEYYEATSIENAISESISAFYANGALNLNNLNGYNATIVSLDGSTVAGFQINGEEVEVPVTLNKGIYLLNATNGNNRTAVKFIVR